MLQDDLKTKVASHLFKIKNDVIVSAQLGDDERSNTLSELLADLDELSDRIDFKFDSEGQRRPSVTISSADAPERSVQFAGLPLGKQFTSFVLALLWAGGHPPKASAALLEKVRGLRGDFHFETYFSLECDFCAEVVQTLTLMAFTNPRVSAVSIQGSAFPSEMRARNIRGVPSTFLNGKWFSDGNISLDSIVTILTGKAELPSRDVNPGPTPQLTTLGSNPTRPDVGIFPAKEGLDEETVAMFLHSLPPGARLVVVDDSNATSESKGQPSSEPDWWRGIVPMLESAGFDYTYDEPDLPSALPEGVARALDRLLPPKNARTLLFTRKAGSFLTETK